MHFNSSKHNTCNLTPRTRLHRLFKHFAVYHHLAQTSYILPVKHAFSTLRFSSRPRNQTCTLRIMCPISSDHPRSRIIYCQKLEYLVYFCRRHYGSIASASLSKLTLKANVVGEMKPNNGITRFKAIQYHHF